MLKLYKISLFLLIILQACEREPEIITGSITGRITIYDQTYKALSDRSGIQVSLIGGDDVTATDITNSSGGYLFENIPYGKYKINLKKEKYIQGWKPPFFYHVGGYSPTFYSLSIICEVPTYELSLDSISYYSDGPDLIIHLKFNGDTVITRNSSGYPFIAYAGSTPDVSKDSFITMGKGYLRDYWIYSSSPKVAVYGRVSCYEFYPRIENAITGTVYMRIYPLANGQGIGTREFYREALGKPSNVISFRWNELTAK